MNLKVTEYDKYIYETQIKDFLPDSVFDFHTHVWYDAPKPGQTEETMDSRTDGWSSLVAKNNSIEDLTESLRLLFPGKKTKALIFSNGVRNHNAIESNEYIRNASKTSGYPALYYSRPTESPKELYDAILKGQFYGVKSYLELAAPYIPSNEIRIFDFFPEEQLKVLNELKMVVMCHIPRNGRFRDMVNLNQLRIINDKYPDLKLIVAHVGRAYAMEDLGDPSFTSFDYLKDCNNLYYDITANTNAEVFTKMLEYISPDRIFFGSDLPITYMHMRRIVDEKACYWNLVPPGIYGDLTNVPHMRDVSAEEGEKLTFFIYEEILAMKKAAENAKLSKQDVANIFNDNAERMIKEIKERYHYE